MSAEWRLYAGSATARDPVVVVTDAPELLERWRGADHLARLVAVDEPGDRPLAPRASMLLRTIDEAAVELLRGLDWRSVERCDVTLLRGLARHPLTLEVLDALAATGLEPTAVARRHLGAFDGVELSLERPAGRGLAPLALAGAVATLGRSLLPVRSETPRVAVGDLDGAWTDGLDNVAPVDPRWAEDASLLREASPSVALVRHTELEGPLAGALAAVRELGGRIVSDTGATRAADATLEGLPVPVPRAVFASHRLYASAPEEVGERDAAALLELAAAGAPLAGAEQDQADEAALDPQLVALLRRPAEELAGAPSVLHMHQIRLRRAVLDGASVPAVYDRIGARVGAQLVRTPRLLVVGLAATGRGADRLVADDARQRHADRELVLVGAAPTTGAAPVRERASLAEVLALARTAGADLITLFEEDVRYGPEHLGDLVRATRLTEADLLLRPAELVVDPSTGRVARTRVPAVEGPTRDPEALALAARTEDLACLDPDLDVGSATTTSLSEALLGLGARAYRTHGLGLLGSRVWTGSTAEPIESAILEEIELGALV